MNSTESSIITRFFKQEASGGILLMVAAAFAIILANTPLNIYYNLIIDTPVAIQIGTFNIAKPLLLWINDGMMAIFFLLVGLELKREFLEGELSNKKNISFRFNNLRISRKVMCYRCKNNDSEKMVSKKTL